MLISIKSLFRSKTHNVSSLVSVSFSSKFPRAKNIIWQQIDVNKWHVIFTLGKKKYTALFNSDGKWMETVSNTTLNKIPKQVQLTFEKKHNRDGIQQIYHVQTPDRNFYEMKLHNGTYVLKLIYDDSGKTLGQLIL